MIKEQSPFDLMNHPQLELPIRSPNDKIRKGNMLARATTGLHEVLPLRIMACIAACVRAEDEDLQLYTIPIKTIDKKYSVNGYRSGATYNKINEAIDYIKQNGWIMINEVPTKDKPKNKCKKEVRWYLTNIVYEPALGIIQASINPQLKEYYVNLRYKYVEYELDKVLLLGTANSHLLFEMLSSFKSLEDVKISIEDIYERLNIPVGSRKGHEFKRILERIQQEIKKHTDLRFVWFTEKVAGKITNIRFIFNIQLAEKIKEEQDRIAKKEISEKRNKLFLSVMACRQKKELANGKCDNPTCSKAKQNFCGEVGSV